MGTLLQSCNMGKVLRLVALFVVLGALTSASGCTRRFFRYRVDAEVDELFCEKDKFPQWKLEQYHIYPDPRSRFADWTDWDRPPRPPDDPAAYKLAPNPQPTPFAGIKYIEGTGYLEMLDYFDNANRARREQEKQDANTNPATEQRGEEPKLPGQTQTARELDQEIEDTIERELTPATTTTAAIPDKEQPVNPPQCRRRPYLVDLAQTVQLGFINSREFQTIREQLYLAALPVTVERFSFIAQPYTTGNFFRERSGKQSVDGPTNRWVANTTAGVTKYLSTGGLLLLNFANQTVYNLGRAGGPVSMSTINFDAVQPLLMGAGRAIALEPLTQAERNLLYAIRDFMRSRREFFVFFAAGQAAFIPGVQAGVGAFTPATLTLPGAFIPGATPIPTVTSGNPANVQVSPGAGGRLLPNPGAGPTTQGYISTVTERAQLVNFYKNIQALRRFLNLFEVYLEGGLVTQVQKGLVEQQLLTSISTTLGMHVSYRVSLDQLKQQLGLPLTLVLDLDDAPLRPIISLTERYELLSFNVHRASNAVDQLGRMARYRQARRGLSDLMNNTPLLKGTRAQETILRRWRQLRREADKEKDRIRFLQTVLDRMIEQRQGVRQRQRALRGTPLPAEDQRRFLDLLLDIDLVEFELALSIYEQGTWLAQANPILQQRIQASQFRAVKRTFLGLADYAFGERQTGIRESWPPLPPICADGVDVLSAPEDEALGAVMRTALAHRVDLMNVRAELVDSWRKIRVAANALLGTFTLDYHLNSITPPGEDRPFDFSGSRTAHQLIFDYSVPWVRILQRNNYRSTLIAYQQARRQVMLREDQVLFDVRFDLRQVRAAANNIHVVQKRNIELAFMQVDQALEAFSQPQAPIGSDPVGLVGPVAARPTPGDAAALTNQLLSTQASLLNARNILYSTWTGYLIQRMNIYRDMATMQIDPTGVWIDNQEPCNCQLSAGTAANGPQQRSSDQQPPHDQPPGKQPEELPTPRRQPERLTEPRLLDAVPSAEME